MRTPGRRAQLEELAQAYLASLRQRYCSHTLQAHTTRVLAALGSFLRRKRVRDLRPVSEAHLVRFARELVARNTARPGGLSLATQRAYLQVLRSFFAFLVRQGVLLADPARELPLPRVTTLPRHVLSRPQARRLVSAPQPITTLGQRDGAIFEVLYGSGLRVGECARLDLIDIDLSEGSLLVRNGKGRKDRLVPLTRPAAAALERYLRDGRPAMIRSSRLLALFPSAPGRLRIEVQAIEGLVRKHARAARIKVRVSPHSLRHACATHLLQGGASIRHVQELLGHRDLATTQRYTRVEVTDLRKLLEKCHPRERAHRRVLRRRRSP